MLAISLMFGVAIAFGAVLFFLYKHPELTSEWSDKDRH